MTRHIVVSARQPHNPWYMLAIVAADLVFSDPKNAP